MASTIHSNARTTPQIRRELQEAPSGVSDPELARRYGITRMTVRNWRYRNDVEDRSHRPETHIARKRGSVRAMPEGPERDHMRAAEWHKAQLRSIVQHPLHVVKNLFGYRKVRYRGLKKNTAQPHSLFALANLYRARRWGLLPEG